MLSKPPTGRVNHFVFVPWSVGDRSLCKLRGQFDFAKEAINLLLKRGTSNVCRYPLVFPARPPGKQQPPTTQQQQQDVQKPPPFVTMPQFARTISSEGQFETYTFLIAGHTTGGNRLNGIEAIDFADMFFAAVFGDNDVATAFAQQIERRSSRGKGGRGGQQQRAAPTITMRILFQTCNSGLACLRSGASEDEERNAVVSDSFIGRFTNRLLYMLVSSRTSSSPSDQQLSAAAAAAPTSTTQAPAAQQDDDDDEESSGPAAIPVTLNLEVVGYRGFVAQLCSDAEILVQNSFKSPSSVVAATRVEVSLSTAVTNFTFAGRLTSTAASPPPMAAFVDVRLPTNPSYKHFAVTTSHGVFDQHGFTAFGALKQGGYASPFAMHPESEEDSDDYGCSSASDSD